MVKARVFEFLDFTITLNEFLVTATLSFYDIWAEWRAQSGRRVLSLTTSNAIVSTASRSIFAGFRLIVTLPLSALALSLTTSVCYCAWSIMVFDGCV